MNGRSELHIKRSNMNFDRYVDILRRHVLSLGDSSADWIGFSRTTMPLAQESCDQLVQNSGIQSLRWPARSPDLNLSWHCRN